MTVMVQLPAPSAVSLLDSVCAKRMSQDGTVGSALQDIGTWPVEPGVRSVDVQY